MRPYRKEKVASTIRTIVSEVIAHRLHDPRVEKMTTVTRVVMSPDLLTAKVRLSIRGESGVQRRTLRAVRHAAGYIQRLLARELTMRHCPELRFEIDEAAEGLRRTMELLAENKCGRNETGSDCNPDVALEPLDTDIPALGALENPQDAE
ncbi:MAG: 30S ribosome-binding factor RbfA [Phycisphaerae bacterium]